MCDCMIERKFSATHSLANLGVAAPHGHDYIARFGFRHEASPFSGAVGSKGLAEWLTGIDPVVALVAGKDLNEILAPRPPTLEMLTLYLLAHLAGFFDYVEVEAYEPRMICRIERGRARLEWTKAQDDGGGPYGTPE